MKITKFCIENFRSYRKYTEIEVNSSICIFIGPNGGGKTNTVDAIQLVLRRFLLKSYQLNVDPQRPEYKIFTEPSVHLPSLFPKHAGQESEPQRFLISLRFDAEDLSRMSEIAEAMGLLDDSVKRNYGNIDFDAPVEWLKSTSVPIDVDFAVVNYAVVNPTNQEHVSLFAYLNQIEKFNMVLSEAQAGVFSPTLLYLPINRSSHNLGLNVILSNYDESQSKNSVDWTTSKAPAQFVSFAIGRLARKRRALEYRGGDVSEDFRNDPICQKLTTAMAILGYNWEIKCVNINSNEYTIYVRKNSADFDARFASSGELEIFNYIFSIYALDVKGAIIIVDEPELHLHPRWQKTVLSLFRQLSAETHNQFILCTHSATFVTPEAVGYIVRVYLSNNATKVTAIDREWKIKTKHLLSIINSFNNERVFFSDGVLLVEGISDRLFFERLFEDMYPGFLIKHNIEIISVGGKGLFDLYADLLRAGGVQVLVLADFDYMAQVGDSLIKKMLSTNKKAVSSDIVLNNKSLDGRQFFDHLREAIITEDMEELKKFFDFISLRRLVRPKLNLKQNIAINRFVRVKYETGVFVLKRGSLEAYLPEGYAGKDLEKLIALIDASDFRARLPSRPKAELASVLAKMRRAFLGRLGANGRSV